MKNLLCLFVVILACGCTDQKSKHTQDMTATITHVAIEYEKEYGKISGFDNHKIYGILVGKNTKNLMKYTPYAEEEKAERLFDAWGRELRFFRNQKGQLIAWSAGVDGVFSDTKGADDILGDFYPVIKSK